MAFSYHCLFLLYCVLYYVLYYFTYLEACYLNLSGAEVAEALQYADDTGKIAGGKAGQLRNDLSSRAKVIYICIYMYIYIYIHIYIYIYIINSRYSRYSRYALTSTYSTYNIYIYIYMSTTYNMCVCVYIHTHRGH